MDNSSFHKHDYDLFGLKEFAFQIREIARPLMEAMQTIRDLLHPIIQAADKHRQEIIKFGQAFKDATRFMIAIEQLGEAQYVYWDYMSSDFIDAVIESKNINKTLREMMIRDRFCKVNDTIERTIESKEIQKYERLYSQSVKAFRNGDCDLAITGFSSVFDGVLTIVSDNSTSHFTPRIKTIEEKLKKHSVLDHEEYAMLTLAWTLEKTLVTISKFSNFDGKEPKGLNRHWIGHGRTTRKKTKLDCVKMINLIYGLLLVRKLDETALGV